MASKQTEHLKLCQWEAEDEVLRADFNADNAKIDTAVARASALAETAYSPAQPPYVVGTYTGNGAAKHFISLGFTPTAVLVASGPYGFTAYRNNGSDIIYGGLAVTGSPAQVAEITQGGFNALFVSNYITANNKNEKYFYIALR